MLANFAVVNSLDLQPDGEGGLEVVPGSLRDAIIAANGNGEADTITFEGFAFETPQVISLQDNGAGDFGDLEITSPITIEGLGPQKITIMAAGGNRIFTISDGDDARINVDIEGLKLLGGSVFGNEEEGQGGAIRNEENLTLTSVEIGNSTAGNGGGAIFHDLGGLTIDQALIRDNSSPNGGGIQIGGAADQMENLPVFTISNSTITGNTATGFEASGYGGGIFTIAGRTYIEQSTIVGNAANTGGAGVASQGFDPMAEEGTPTVYSGGATTNIRSSIIVGNVLGNDPSALALLSDMNAMVELDDVGSVGMTEGDDENDPAPFEPQINSFGYNLFGVLTFPPTTANMDVVLPPMGPEDFDGVDPFTLFLGPPDPQDVNNPERAVPALGDYGGETFVFLPDLQKLGAAERIINKGPTSSVNGFVEQRGRHFSRVASVAAPVRDADDEMGNNDTIATAQNIDGEDWRLLGDDNIAESRTFPHVTILGTGDGTFDYYEFTVANDGDRAIFDIDFSESPDPMSPFNTQIFLYQTDGTFLAENDDSSVDDGASGSISELDSFLEYTFATAGTYVIGVAEFGSTGDPGGITGSGPSAGTRYTLQVSVENHEIPDATAIMDIGAVEVQNGVFVVDTLLDETDGQFLEGDFSLREALQFSDKNPQRDTVFFSSTLREDADPNPFTPAPTIVMSLGAFTVGAGVDISGPTFQLELDANLGSRVFTIDDDNESNEINVLVRNLTILNGGGVINGGAIWNSEDLTLQDSYLLKSSAALNGGALFVQDGDVLVDSSTFFENFAANQGGGIYIARDDVEDADVDGTPDLDARPAVTITNSTVSTNDAANRGAGIANHSPRTHLEYSTVTLNNAASTLGSGIGNFGGNFSNGVITILSTIIADNVNSDIGAFGGPSSNIISEGYNLVGATDIDSFDQVGDQVGDFINPIDPRLAPITFTGGLTPAHRLLDDSPAVDAGDPNAVGGVDGVPEFDQRGDISNPTFFVRVFDPFMTGTPLIDIGAYELQEVTYTVDNILDENDGNFGAGEFSLREAIEVANASDGDLPESIVFDPTFVPSGSTIVLSPDLPNATPDLRITSALNIIGTGITLNGAGLTGLLGATFPMIIVDDGDDQSTFEASIEGFTFVNGAANAITNRETLTIQNVDANSNNQGVFQNLGGNLTVKTSVLTGNTNAGGGGGILSVDGNLTIEGGLPNSYDYTLITGNETEDTLGHGGGVSFIDNTLEGKTLSLRKVIISGNRAPAGNTDGGGIYIAGNESLSPTTVTDATIQQTVISGNTTTGSNSEGTGLFAKDANVQLLGTTVSLNKSYGTNAAGAGIFVSGGSMTIDNYLSLGGSYPALSLVTQNRTYGNYAPGAGIANDGGNLTVNALTISRNVASGVNSHGGGIYSSGGNLTINSSTVTNNQVTYVLGKGGGVYSVNDLATQSTSVFNSTLSGNTAPYRGGGAYNAGGLLSIKYSTITDNSIDYFGNGGGVASLGDDATTRTEVKSSIIAGNHAVNDLVNPNSDVDFVGGVFANTFLSMGYNVIGKGLALDAFNAAGDQSDIDDPGLAPLVRDSGSPTSTHALLPTSPAINRGDPSAEAGVGDVPEFDQRGPGFDRVVNGRIDAGSYESPFAPLVTSAPSDFNGDFFVTGLDFLVWQRGIGTPNATKSDGDANEDLMVDDQDLAIWETEYTAPPEVTIEEEGTALQTPGLEFLAWQRSVSAPSASVTVEEAAMVALFESSVETAEVIQTAPLAVQLDTATEESLVGEPPTAANPFAPRTVFFASLSRLSPIVDWGEIPGRAERLAAFAGIAAEVEGVVRERFDHGSVWERIPSFFSADEDDSSDESPAEDSFFEELGTAFV